MRCLNPYVEPCTLYGKCPDRICDKYAILLWQNFPATPFGGRGKKIGEKAKFSLVFAPTNHPGMSCVRSICENLKGARLEFRRNRWVKVSLNFWILGSQHWSLCNQTTQDAWGGILPPGHSPSFSLRDQPRAARRLSGPHGVSEGDIFWGLKLGSLRESGYLASKTDNQSLPGDLGQLYSYL